MDIDMKPKTPANGKRHVAVFVSGDGQDHEAELNALQSGMEMPYPGRPGQVIVLADGDADKALQTKTPEVMYLGSCRNKAGDRTFRYYQVPTDGAATARR